MRYVHTHFSPNNSTTPCFISYGGAMFLDVPALLEYLPEHVDTLLLHVSTTDILKSGSEKSLDSLRETLQRVRQMRSTIKLCISACHCLVHPIAVVTTRTGASNWRFVSKFNREVQRFNREARHLCHYGMLGAGVFYVEHGFSTLPLRRFLAADGLHASFEGVALLAQHTSVQLRRTSAAWRSAPTPCTTNSGDKPTQQREAEERPQPPSALAVAISPPLPARRYNTRRTHAATTKSTTSN
ncbi:hypothetical protein MTO96_030006 [Rhipicephalus appendiculatus]